MFEGLKNFITPEPETGNSVSAILLHIGSKIVVMVGIIMFLIGMAMYFLTFDSRDRFETTGTITEMVDLPDSEQQRVTIEYMDGQTAVSKTDTTSGFREYHHNVGDEVKLLVGRGDVFLVEAIPAFRFSFIKTALVGVILIVVSVIMRKRSRRNS